jgi:hypothetical protein
MVNFERRSLKQACRYLSTALLWLLREAGWRFSVTGRGWHRKYWWCVTRADFISQNWPTRLSKTRDQAGETLPFRYLTPPNETY